MLRRGRDLFYEYVHGDNGAGIGASHLTGRTGTVAGLMHFFATVSPEQVLELSKMAYAETTARGMSGQNPAVS